MFTKIQRNNFGILSKDYDAARKGYPEELFRYLKKITCSHGAKVLDIGCGTGISTRQLKQHKFQVVGVDKENAMIKIAKSKRDDIPYVIAPADELPFRDGTFDFATAFTAFHWFADKRSINEIKRILKNGGMFIIVQKKSLLSNSKRLEQINKGYRTILRKYFGRNADSMKGCDPEKILRKNGFKKIIDKEFFFKEKYTLSHAMMLLRSISNWNLLSDDLRQRFYQEVKELYKKNLIDGKVIKNRKATVTIGVAVKKKLKR